MRKKKIWAKVLALSLCAMLTLPVSAFAAGTAEGNVVESPIEEQVKSEETKETTGTGKESTLVEEDVLPTIGKTTLKLGEDGLEMIKVPITSGSGKYKASSVEFRLESIPGIQPWVCGIKLSEGQSVYDAYAAIDFNWTVTSGKAGTYDVRVVFQDENGKTVHEDTESVKFLVEEDWSLPDYNGGQEFSRAWDGSSDVVFPFDPGTGMGKIARLRENEPSDGLGKYDLILSPKGGNDSSDRYIMRYGTDCEVDIENGKFIIKGSFLKRIAEENKSFGAATFYSTHIWYQQKTGNGLNFLYFCLTYDRDAAQPGGDTTPGENTKPVEVTLPKESTVVTADKVAQLVEQNKQKDVVIHTPNGVSFTFAKGTMKLIDGKESYDFGTTITTDLKESKISGVSEDEFAFRVNYNYSGALPGKAKISIPLGADSKWIGKTLYYAHTESGKITEQIYQNVVDANGVYTVEQEHCSDYVATTKDMNAKQENVKSPKTGDTANAFPYFVIVFALGVLVLGANREKARLR